MKPLNNNTIFVYDFETWNSDPRTCEVVQVAGLAIDPRNLEVVPNSEYKSYLRPLDMKNFSPKAIEVNGIKPEMVENAPDRESVWRSFAAHVAKFGRGSSTAPSRPGTTSTASTASSSSGCARRTGCWTRRGCRPSSASSAASTSRP
jgi:hypothetical protein